MSARSGVSLATPRLAVPRRWAAPVAGIVGLLSALARAPLGVAVAVVLLTALLIMPEQRTTHAPLRDLLAWIPIAAAVAFGGLAVALVLTGLARMPLWGDSRGVASACVVLAALTVGGALRGGRVGLGSAASLIAWIPAMIYLGASAYRFSHDISWWSRGIWPLSDWMNHAEMVADLYRRGLLDYRDAVPGSDGVPTMYPRVLHSLLAWLVDIGVPGATLATAWPGVITALAASAAVMAVLVISASGMLCMHLAVRIRVAPWVPIAAVVATFGLLLQSGVHQILAVSGFLTTELAALLLVAAVLVVGTGRTRQGYALRLCLLVLLVAGMVNAWQVMALPVGMIACYASWRWWRGGRAHVVWIAGSCALAAVAITPLLAMSLTRSSVEWTSAGISMQPFPWAVTIVLCGLPVLVLSLNRWRASPVGPALLLGLVTGLSMGLALIYTGGGSLAEIPYYAGKVIWHAEVLAIPATVFCLLLLVQEVWDSQWIAQLSRGSAAIRVGIVGLPLVVLAAFVAGRVEPGIKNSMSGIVTPGGITPPIALLVTDLGRNPEDRGRPVMVWTLSPQGWQLESRMTDWHAMQVLRTLGFAVADGNVAILHAERRACTWLEDHPNAVRVTGPLRGDKELMRHGCPVEVVRPAEWIVLVSPPEWWVETPWESTGGAPDPTTLVPDKFFS